MKTNLFLCVVVWAMLSVSFGVFAQSANAVLGTWLNEEKESKIEIYEQGDQFFGKIVWLKEPNTANGMPKRDDKNPDPKRQSDPILGSVLMRGFSYSGNGTWENGTIYDGRSGTLYKCRMRLKGQNQLDVRGYVGAAWMGLGKTTTWTRVKETVAGVK